MARSEKISVDEARKLVLHSQRLYSGRAKGKAVEATLDAVEHLGYVQIDTISVIERAHHHTLWNRSPRFIPEHIDQLIADRSIYEYWSHAAAFLPMSDYRYSLPRKMAIKSGEQSHWFERDEQLIRYVLDRVKSEGPLMAKDFEKGSILKKAGAWSVKPTKQALETLYMEGELMVSSRKNFHKVYDLTERVLPVSVDATVPTQEEYARFLIRRFLESNGIARANEIIYLRRNVKKAVADSLKQMLADGELREVKAVGQTWYALPNSLDLLSKPLARSKLKILSPFDNLVIQRQRMLDLFNFEYQIECYLPAQKRKYGYFSLPILWNGSLVARIDCKADRKASELMVRSLHLEPSLQRKGDFQAALERAMNDFMSFNDCKSVTGLIDSFS